MASPEPHPGCRAEPTRVPSSLLTPWGDCYASDRDMHESLRPSVTCPGTGTLAGAGPGDCRDQKGIPRVTDRGCALGMPAGNGGSPPVPQGEDRKRRRHAAPLNTGLGLLWDRHRWISAAATTALGRTGSPLPDETGPSAGFNARGRAGTFRLRPAPFLSKQDFL